MATINGIPGRQSWSWFTSIATGTQVLNYYYDQCVALANLYNQSVIGGPFIPVGSAFQWWTEFGSLGLSSLYTQSSTPVAGAIFVAKGGIYDNINGHIGVVTSVNGNGTMNTMEQNTEVNRFVGRALRSTSSGILGYLIPRNNPAGGGGGSVGASQRVAGPYGAKRRAGASTTSKDLGSPLKPGEIGNFKGYVWGQDVNDGRIHTALWYVGTSGNYFWAGGFTSVKTAGLKNLTPAPALKENQRKVGKNNANVRADANSSAKYLGVAKAGSVHTLSGWKKGQKVSDSVATSDIWFKGTTGWVWAGAFTSQSTKGLKDLNPVPPKPASDSRTVGKNPANVRKTPNTKAAVVAALKAGSVNKVLGWVNGEEVKDTVASSKIWFKVASGWVWSGAFTSQSTTGLTNLNSEGEATPTPPPAEEEFVYKEPNVKDLDFAKLLPWVKCDTVLDNEIGTQTAKEWNSDLYKYYNSKGEAQQYEVSELHAHWWGDPSTKPSHDGTVSYIQSKDALTVNTVISANRLTKMMPLTYAATTTGGPVNMRAIKFEIDPVLTDEVYKTVGAVLYVIERENPKLGELPVRLHKEFTATACSEIDPKTVRLWANRFKSGEWDILTGKKKAVNPTPSAFPLKVTLTINADGTWTSA